MALQPPLRLVVRLTPRGGRDAVEGWARDDGGLVYLKVRVAAPPVNGAANAALGKLIAKRLKCSPGAVRIVAGDHGRLKHLEIDGVERADVDRVFGPPV